MEANYAGNRDSVAVSGNDAVNYSYQNTHNKIQSVSENGMAKTYDYDYKGNVIRKGSDVYYWDYKNRLVMAYIQGGNVSYKYNINDLRLERTSSGKTTRYYYNGSRLLCEKDTSGKLTKVYLHDDEGFLGMTRHVYDDSGVKKASQNLYYLFDDLGSITTVTGETGMPVQMYSYDPYGNVTNAETDPVNNLAFVGRFGGYKDWDTNLTNFWHRWYDSKDGRWTSRDPIGVRGGVNLYGYVKNRVSYYIDIEGFCSGPEPMPLRLPGQPWIEPNWSIWPTLPIDQKVTKYNYCGKNYSNKTFHRTWREENDYSLPPQNATDTCCRNHDLCSHYVLGIKAGSIKTTSPGMDIFRCKTITDCNKDAVNCFKTVGFDPVAKAGIKLFSHDDNHLGDPDHGYEW